MATDDDGDRYTIDIPNDPNLLSFLVQHKVEINVAPINAQGGIGGTDGAHLSCTEGAFDKLLQTFIVPGCSPRAFSCTQPLKFCSLARKI